MPIKSKPARWRLTAIAQWFSAGAGRTITLSSCTASSLIFLSAAVHAAAPVPQQTGDQHRLYDFAAAGASSGYRLYVPQSWAPGRKLPMVVILHGHSGDENSPFDKATGDLKGIVQTSAEKYGFIVVAPRGYGKADFGNTYPIPDRQAFKGDANPGSEQEVKRNNDLSEQDALNVVELVSREYCTDPQRLYLMGNSGGSMGTLFLAAKYPQLWAAISASDGPVEPSLYPFEKLKGLQGARILHGELDTTASMDAMKEIAQKIAQQGVDTEFLLVPGERHGTAWYRELPRTFEFFQSRVKRSQVSMSMAPCTAGSIAG